MSTVVKIDSRMCVKRTENGFSIDRQDMALPDSIEVLARIVFYLRARDFVMPMIASEVIDSMEVYPAADDTQTPRICIAFDYRTHKIQLVITGLTKWEACVLLEIAKSYLINLQLGLITE